MTIYFCNSYTVGRCVDECDDVLIAIIGGENLFSSGHEKPPKAKNVAVSSMKTQGLEAAQQAMKMYSMMSEYYPRMFTILPRFLHHLVLEDILCAAWKVFCGVYNVVTGSR